MGQFEIWTVLTPAWNQRVARAYWGMSATSKTIQLLLAAWFAFLLGGYVTKGSDWPVLVLSGGALVGLLLMLIREFWKPNV